MEYFCLAPLISYHHQLQHLHYFLHLNISPYIPPRRLQMELVSVPLYARPDAVDISDQDCLVNLRDTRLVGNLAC